MDLNGLDFVHGLEEVFTGFDAPDFHNHSQKKPNFLSVYFTIFAYFSTQA